MNVTDYRNRYNQYIGQRNSIEKLLKEEEKNNEKLKQDEIDSATAHNILSLVGQQTQEQLTFRIENLVTAGLEYVFDDSVKFKVEFDTRRNQQQCDIFFEKDGTMFDPIKDSEGTLLDVTSFLLRLAMWSLPQKKSSPIIVGDELGKHISRGYRGAFSQLMREMCTRLGIQIIMISHDELIMEASDNIIKIVKDGKYSKKEK